MPDLVHAARHKNEGKSIPYPNVLMPNSAHNLELEGSSEQRRFIIMQECWVELKAVIKTITHQNEGVIFERLKNCLQICNPKLQEGNLNILEDLCQFIANEKCEKFCLLQLLMGIIEMAEELHITLPLLCQNKQNFVRITKSQAASLLANAFLCAFPNRERGRDSPFSSYPRINFNELYDDTHNTIDHSWRSRARTAKLEKLKCLMNYFKRCIERRKLSSVDNGDIIFERRVLSPEEFFDWGQCNKLLLMVKAYSDGAIEDAQNKLQVDFANEFVGGGTLGNGSAMEEIRFITCPELIVAQLFTERLNNHEALVVQGFEQFSTYTGYGSSFQFGGDYEQDIGLTHQLVVLDALRFPRDSKGIQYTKESIDRELYKCLVGFRSKENDQIRPTQIPIVASGKWGCGVFNGDPELKSVIQWMAASVANLGLELYTFGDGDFTHKMNELSQLVKDHELTVGFMYKAVTKYGKLLQQRSSRARQSLIHFLKLEIIPEKKVGRKYSTSGSDEDEVVETRKVVRTRKIQSRQPQQNLPSTSISTSNLVPAQKPGSYWISNVFCMFQKIIPTISAFFANPIFFCLRICKMFGSLVKPGLWVLFKVARQLINKMINFQNPQAALMPRQDEGGIDREKEALDLSDSD